MLKHNVLKINKYIALILVFYLLIPVLLFSGATGKISGNISDDENGEPLIGANIVIVHEIINGEKVQLATMMGAATDLSGDFVILNIKPGKYYVEFRMMGYQTKVFKDVIVSINRTTRLSTTLSSEVIMGEAVIVEAQKETIKKDMTSGMKTVSSEDMETLILENISDAVNLQTGVVDGHFRGGRDGEVVYLVEGMASGITIHGDAIKELEVISGTFNAEYGKVMSGIVNTAPKEGGSEFDGNTKVFSGNYFTSHDYTGLEVSDVFHTTEARLSLSGPIPFTADKGNFFIFSNASTDDGLYYGINRYSSKDQAFVGAGIPEREWIDIHTGNGKYAPMSNRNSQSLMANLTYKLSQSIKTSLLYQYENTEGRQGYNHSYKYIPNRTNKYWNKKSNFTLSLTNILSPFAFHELKLLYLKKNDQSSRFKDPYDSRYVNDIYNTYIGGFYAGGNSKGFYYNKDEKWQLKYDLVWQINKHHEIKIGADYVDLILDRNQYSLQNWFSIFDPSQEATKYQPYIPHDTTTYADSFNKNPIEFSAYFQDKAEFNSLVINFGLRFDWFDPNTIYPTDLRNPANRIITERQTDYNEAKAQSQVSPRLGLSYAIGEEAALHFSYGHFFQIPNYSRMFTNPNYEISTTNYSSKVGNPKIKAEKTVKYEMGLQLRVTNDISLNTDIFYHDIYNLETVIPIETYDAIIYGFYSNLDYASSRGLTAELEYKKGPILAKINYTLQYAEGNASQPNSNFTKAAKSIDPITTLIPLDWDQRHTLNIAFGYNKESWGLSLTGRYGSGTRYTYSPPTESRLSLINIPENGYTKPPTYYLDLKGFYDFNLLKSKNTEFRIGLYVYNFLDIRNAIRVYTDTGTANSTTNIERDKDDYVSTFTDIYDLYDRPNYYSAPRSIKLELSIMY